MKISKEELNRIVESHQEWLQTRFSDDTEGQRANLSGCDLRGANLSGCDLRGANLSGANLSGCDLRGADLLGCDLSEAVLREANLSGANLSGCDLRGANLSGCDLRGANLSGANLRWANLSEANLREANLRWANLSEADLEPVKSDYFAVLSAAPAEVPGVLAALKEGRVDGSAYQGECACLVGTIANLRGEYYEDLTCIIPDSSRPAELWFLAIREGHTPENCPVTKITADWTEEWLAANTAPAK